MMFSYVKLIKLFVNELKPSETILILKPGHPAPHGLHVGFIMEWVDLKGLKL